MLHTSEDPELVELYEMSFPPKPKETPALCLYHFGALKGPKCQKDYIINPVILDQKMCKNYRPNKQNENNI